MDNFRTRPTVIAGGVNKGCLGIFFFFFCLSISFRYPSL